MGKSCFFIGKKPSISKNKIQKDDQRSNNKSKRRWFVRSKSNDSVSLPREHPSAASPPPPSSPPPPLSPPRPYLPSSSPRLSTENVKPQENEEEQTKEVLADTTTAIAAVEGDKEIAEDVSLTECVPGGNIDTKEDDEEQSEQVLTIASAMADNETVQDTVEVVPQMEPIELENVETKEDDEEQPEQEQGLTIPSAVVKVQVTIEVVPLMESITTGNDKTKEDEKEQIRHASDIPTAIAADATIEDSTEVIPTTDSIPLAGNSSEEAAAIKIQTAYRAYMGRRALRALRELWRLKPSVKGQNMETQSATSTLRSMQTLARVQSDIRQKRSRMSHEKQHNNNNNSNNKSNKSTHSGEDWNVSTKSKEQIEASLLLRKEAAERRERALAYASSHQLARKSSSKTLQQTDMDPEDPQWGWRWLEKWMAVRPWETQSRESNADPHDQNLVKTPAGCEPTTQAAKPQKTMPRQKTRKGIKSNGRIHGIGDNNDDLRSVQSERYNHRHSSVTIGSPLSVKDDHESVSDKPSVKKTVKARASLSTTPGHLASKNKKKNVLEKKRPVGSLKKRISFSGMPAGTRELADLVNNATVRRSTSGRVNQGSED